MLIRMNLKFKTERTYLLDGQNVPLIDEVFVETEHLSDVSQIIKNLDKAYSKEEKDGDT
ncbi:MAG: hypothetical protein H3Z50_07730 [archaeon]|nr:hypothetical protein [archaeon]